MSATFITPWAPSHCCLPTLRRYKEEVWSILYIRALHGNDVVQLRMGYGRPLPTDAEGFALSLRGGQKGRFPYSALVQRPSASSCDQPLKSSLEAQRERLSGSFAFRDGQPTRPVLDLLQSCDTQILATCVLAGGGVRDQEAIERLSGWAGGGR